MLDSQIEFSLTSLFGKLGAALIQYDIESFESNTIRVAGCEQFRQALVMTS
jgi:hypothetical protein